MKNTKLLGVIAVVLAVIVLVLGAVIGFDRGADIGGSYVLSVQINETFKVKDIEAIVKEAGATGCVVQSVQKQTATQYANGEGVLISFEVEDDTKAKEVADKVETLIREKYSLAFPGEFEFFSSTLNRQAAIEMWPVAIIFVLLLVYGFIRFGVKTGFVFIADMFIPTAIAAGLVAIAGIKVTNFTIPALLLTMALAFMFTFIFAILLKEASKRVSAEEAFDQTQKQVNKLAVVVLSVAVVGFAVLLIIGSTLLKNFALISLVGAVLNMATIVYVLPSFLKK